MSDALAFIEKHVLNSLLGQIAPSNPDRVIRKLLLGLMGLFYLITTTLIIISSYIWFHSLFELHVTLLLTSAVTFGFMIFNGFVLYSISRFKRKKIKDANQKINAMFHQGLEILDDEFSLSIMKHPKTSVLIGMVSGYLTGEAMKNMNIANDTKILTEKIRGTYIKR